MKPNRNLRKANKRHTCWNCDGPIHKGEQYVREVQLDQEGRHVVLKYHEDCPMDFVDGNAAAALGLRDGENR